MIRPLFFNYLIFLANFSVPLLVIPLIINGYSEFELASYLFYQYQLALLVVVVDWGGAINGISTIARLEAAVGKLGFIFGIFLFRSMVALVCILVLLILNVYLFERGDLYIGMPILISVFGFAVSPLFYLQYKESLVAYSLINFLSKLLFLMVVLVYLSLDVSFGWVAWSFMVCYLIPSVSFLIYFLYGHKTGEALDLIAGFKYCKTNFLVMLSSFGSSAYRVLPMIFAGNVLNVEQFNVLAVLDRIVRAGVTLVQPLSQTIMPLVIKSGISYYYFLLYVTLGLLISIGLYLFGDIVIAIMMSKKEFSLPVDMEVYFFLPLVVVIGSYLGSQRLIVESQYNVFYGAIFSVALISVTVLMTMDIHSAQDFIVICLLSELLVLIGFLCGCRAKKIKLF